MVKKPFIIYLVKIVKIALLNSKRLISKTISSSLLGTIEKKIRRQYFNGNELLGRGKILKSYEKGDIEYIKKIAKKRLNVIRKKC